MNEREKYARRKRIDAIMLGLVGLAIFISLFVVLCNRPFSKLKLADNEKAAVLELQERIASNKVIDAADIVNSQIDIQLQDDGMTRIVYQYRVMDTHYEVVADYDANFNVVRSEIYNNNAFHVGIYVVYAILALGASFALAFVSLAMYDEYYY